MASGPSPESPRVNLSTDVLGELAKFLPAPSQQVIDSLTPSLDLSHFESFEQIKAYLCDRSSSGEFGKRVSVAFVELLVSDLRFYDREVKQQIAGLLIYLGTHKTPSVAAVVPELVQSIGLDSPLASCIPALLSHKFGQELIEDSLQSMSEIELKNFVTHLCKDRAVLAVMQIASTLSVELLGRMVSSLDDAMCAALVSMAAQRGEFRPAIIKIVRADSLVNGEERGNRWISGLLSALGTLQAGIIAERSKVEELVSEKRDLAQALAIRVRPETDMIWGDLQGDSPDDFYDPDQDDPFTSANRAKLGVAEIELQSCLSEHYSPQVARAIYQATPAWDDMTKN